MSKAATLRQLYRILLVTIVLLSCEWSLAKADDWDIYLTIDNFGTVYFGTCTKTVGGPVGISNNWMVEDHFVALKQPSDRYLYVAAASDQVVAQGFVGKFKNVTLGWTVWTGDPAWQVFPACKYAGIPEITCPWPANLQPTQKQVDAAIAYASANNLWVTPTSAPGYDLDPLTLTTPYSYVWGYNFPHIWQPSDRPNQAQWIWYESGLVPSNSTGHNFSTPFEGGNHQEFLVFRIAGRNVEEADPDAWIQDKDPCDDGTEPDPCTPIWESDDIRVRNTRVTGPVPGDPWQSKLQHQNPIDGTTNYVYVKLRNRGNTSVTGTLHLYWFQISTVRKWDANNQIPFSGEEIGYGKTVTVGPCPPFLDEVVAEFEWIPVVAPWDFCLLARFESNDDQMRFLEVHNSLITDNARKNNNIALKNLYVIYPPGSPEVLVQNAQALPANVDLEFNSAGGGSGIPFLDGGSVRVVLAPEMFSHWMGAGGMGQGIVVNPNDSSISLTSPLAKIQGIPMGVNETQPVTMYFTPNRGSPSPAFQWFVVSQFSDGQTTPDGGVTFEFRSGAGDIPTLSEWGLIVFGVVFLGFVTWVFLKRRRTVVGLQ
ncbi:MAG: hypothetical protein WCE90_07325 [Candidatus Zixiibacteriota bacterium]